MDRCRIEFSGPALEDLTEITRYIGQRLKEPETARRLRNTLEKDIQSLSFFPARCPIVPDVPYRLMGVRRLLVENYSVFYQIREDRRSIYILRVLYSRREWQGPLDEVLS